MSVETSREQINFTKELYTLNVQCISDCDIIVPDSKPDVKRILEVFATEQLNEKNISRDYINISGTVNYNILYVSDDENCSINRIEYSSPFARQIPAGGISEDDICVVTSDAVHTQYNIYNSRKINVKCAVDLDASVFENNITDVVTGVSDEKILPCKTKSALIHDICSISQNTFHINEMCFGEEGTTISEILKNKMYVSDTSVKMVANKAVVKGNVCAQVLYLSDSNIKEFSQELPFTQIIDTPSYESDMDVNCEFCVKNIAVAQELDTDATMSKFNVQADVNISVMLSREKQIQYVSDIYSPDFDIGVTCSDLKVNSLFDKVSTQYIVNDTIKLSEESAIEKVISLDTKAHIESADVKTDKIEVKGYVNSSLIYMSEEQDIFSEYKQIPFETQVPLSVSCDGGNFNCQVKIESHNSGYNIEGNTKVNIRDVLKLNCNLISENNISVISGVEVDEQSKIDKTGQAGITVYFVQSDDSMWDIAKRYNTTEAEIKQVNRLDENFLLSKGQQLLIPKHN